MYKMKEVCDMVGLSYEALRFYCNEGLVPNVKRDDNNHRIFDEYDIKWIKGTLCLRDCGLSISELKEYLDLCLIGQKSIPERQEILAQKKELLLKEIASIYESIDYIDNKQEYYDRILSGEEEYRSNIIPTYQQ
ncbi:MAG TPA: MerR family transcriptional regulator [Clostridiales bacterium]|nr:MerR family transcriptional regulator [Clostridiales bacterium]